MKKMVATVLLLILGVVLVSGGILLPCMIFGIGNIIGGADKPTWFFLQHQLYGLPVTLILFGAAMVLSALTCLVFFKTVAKYCTVKTSCAALSLSAVASVGLGCALLAMAMIAFGKPSSYPIRLPISIMVGTLAFLAFVILCCLYFKWRKVHPSGKGVLLDVLTAIVYFPVFFFGFNFFYGWLF